MSGSAFQTFFPSRRFLFPHEIQWQDIPSPLDTRELMKRTKEAKLAFILAMDDDFNTCKALGEVFDFVAAVNAQTADKTISLSDVPPVRDARGVIVELMGVFGIDVEAASASCAAGGYPPEVVGLAADIAEPSNNLSRHDCQN